MAISLSIKKVPDDLAARLRSRAERNHRSLQGELLAILEGALNEPYVVGAIGGAGNQRVAETSPTDGLLARLLAIAGDRRVESTNRLTREQAHDRNSLRKAGI
jgi:hypothetical protein